MEAKTLVCSRSPSALRKSTFDSDMAFRTTMGVVVSRFSEPSARGHHFSSSLSDSELIEPPSQSPEGSTVSDAPIEPFVDTSGVPPSRSESALEELSSQALRDRIGAGRVSPLSARQSREISALKVTSKNRVGLLCASPCNGESESA